MTLFLPSPPAASLPAASGLDLLVQRSRSGDPDAFDALVGCLYEPIYRLAYRLLRHPQDAEDATQEVFLKAWRHLPQFRGTAQFTTWLYAIAVHHCLDLSRRRNRDRRLFLSLLREVRGPSRPPLPLLSSRSSEGDLCLFIREAVEALPAPLQTVVLLHYFADLSAPEVAAALRLPDRTVRFRLASALNRLRKAWGEGKAP